MKRKKDPIDITIEELGPYRQQLKSFTITHEFKGRGGDSMMTEWLWTMPENHQIVIGKHNEEVIGWATGVSSNWKEKGYDTKIYDKTTCVIGIYISKDHRKKGYGFQLGKQLFALIKRQGYQRVLMQYRTKGAEIMYKNLSEFIGVKRKPATPPTLNHDKTWKIVKL